MDAPIPRVSIIMRSRNSGWSIAQALSGLFAQEFKDFELLVVDSASTDRTLEIARQYPCRIIDVPPQAYFPGAVLNFAMEQARAEIVVFQNSDAIPLTPYTLGRLVAAFDDPEVQAAYGRQMPRPEAAPWVRRDYAASFPEAGPGPPWITLSLPIAAMRKSVWRERPFYTEAYSSEDTEWGQWAVTHGRKIQYVPDAVVMHSHNYTLRQMYGRRFVEGEADVYIYGGTDSIVKMAAGIARSAANDLAWHVRHGDWAEIPGIPVRRVVYHWAYYKGRKLGERRKASGDTDCTTGQRAVKTRHES